MDKFTKHTGTCAPLFQENIDTDQIVPKKFLLRTERSGFAEALFYDWRIGKNGEVTSNFVLNKSKYKEASILLAGSNFGCGSSREHAPWALYEYGFRAIIAPSFADIFYSNCFKIGLLPVKLSESEVGQLVNAAEGPATFSIEVDLVKKIVSDGHTIRFSFEIDDFLRQSLLDGLDNIDLTLMKESKIKNYEKSRTSFLGKHFSNKPLD